MIEILLNIFFGVLLVGLAFFLIVLVLLQRGKGGGLIGALGGAGGQSPLGQKTGDKITWFTMVVAGIWICVCAGAVKYYGVNKNLIANDLGADAQPDPDADRDDSVRKTPEPISKGKEKETDDTQDSQDSNSETDAGSKGAGTAKGDNSSGSDTSGDNKSGGESKGGAEEDTGETSDTPKKGDSGDKE